MKVINPNAAGIDVGSRSHFVAIGQNEEEVEEFGVYSSDHSKMIVHLKENGIKTIAMESTGSYWQTLYFALQRENFEVLECGLSWRTSFFEIGGDITHSNKLSRNF